MATTNGSGSTRPRVLVVEDQDDIRELVVATLASERFTIDTSADGASTFERLRENPPNAVVLDIELPDVIGLELLRALVTEHRLPVVVLSARSTEADRVAALELGAEDYVVKPFMPRELAVRVRRVIERVVRQGARIDQASARRGTLRSGALAIDFDRREVAVDGVPVELTAKEFDLLAFLATHPGRTFRRADLLVEVWQSSPEWQSAKTVTEHVRRLRRKLEADAAEPRWLKTVSRVGYRFDP